MSTTILGLSVPLFTQIHVAISLIGILSGLIVAIGFMSGKSYSLLTTLFLLTTILTSLTGFLFPFKGVTPGIILGILSLIVLAIALFAHYSNRLAGGWPKTYVITAMIALYFNCFVLIAQSFQKIPSLHALAPTNTEGPFKIAQLVLLILFIVMTVIAVRKFRPAPAV